MMALNLHSIYTPDKHKRMIVSSVLYSSLPERKAAKLRIFPSGLNARYEKKERVTTWQ